MEQPARLVELSVLYCSPRVSGWAEIALLCVCEGVHRRLRRHRHGSAAVRLVDAVGVREMHLGFLFRRRHAGDYHIVPHLGLGVERFAFE